MEVGWEIYDTLDRMYSALFIPGGAAFSPLPLCVILFFHHLTAQCMVVPMNLFFSGTPAVFSKYAGIVFCLQFAAAVGVLAGNYLMTLDTAIPAELFQVKSLAVFRAFIFTSSRGMAFYYLIYGILCEFWGMGSMLMRR